MSTATPTEIPAIPKEDVLARALTANWSALHKAEPRKTPLEIARLLIVALQREAEL
jgi:hypothetical protein